MSLNFLFSNIFCNFWNTTSNVHVEHHLTKLENQSQCIRLLKKVLTAIWTNGDIYGNLLNWLVVIFAGILSNFNFTILYDNLHFFIICLCLYRRGWWATVAFMHAGEMCSASAVYQVNLTMQAYFYNILTFITGFPLLS